MHSPIAPDCIFSQIARHPRLAPHPNIHGRALANQSFVPGGTFPRNPCTVFPAMKRPSGFVGNLGNRFRQDLFCLAGVGAHRFKERLRFLRPRPAVGADRRHGRRSCCHWRQASGIMASRGGKSPSGRHSSRESVAPYRGLERAERTRTPTGSRARAGGKKTATPFGVERHTRTCLLRHKVGKSLESPGYRLSPRGRLSSLAPTAMSCKPGRQLGAQLGRPCTPPPGATASRCRTVSVPRRLLERW